MTPTLTYCVREHSGDTPGPLLMPPATGESGADLLRAFLREQYGRWGLVSWDPGAGLSDLEGVPVLPTAGLFPTGEVLSRLEAFFYLRTPGLDGYAAPFSPPDLAHAEALRPVATRAVAFFNTLRLELARRAVGSASDVGDLKVQLVPGDEDEEADFLLNGTPLRPLLEETVYWVEALLYHEEARPAFSHLTFRLGAE